MTDAEVIVVRDDVPRSAMRAVAERLSWRRTGQTDRGHLVMASERWSPAEGVTATWVDNHTSDVRSVHIAGKGEQLADVATALKDALAHDDAASLVAAVKPDADPIALIRLAGKLATCRPQACDEGHLHALGELLCHDVVAVRRAAVRTAYNYPWPELVPIVEARQAKDPALAAQLQHLLQRLRTG